MTDRSATADAKRLFAEQADDIDRLSRAEGPDQGIGHVRDDLPFAEPTLRLTVRPSLIV